MKRLTLALMLSLAAVAAQAQAQETQAVAQTQAVAEETTVITADAPAQAKAETKANCVRETGSRIKRRDAKGCNGQPGRTYDRDDLEKAGAVDTADALRRLDPSIGG